MSFMLLKNLSDISIQDVQTLCDDKVLESRFLDFKAKAIGRGDSDKRDFLTDVCAFANAAGGDLLLGVKTRKGPPTSCVASKSSIRTRKSSSWSTSFGTDWNRASFPAST